MGRRFLFAGLVVALILGVIPISQRAAFGVDDPEINVLDSVGDVGQFASTALGSDGLPIVAFYDATASDLKVAHCGDIVCSASTVSVVDSVGNVGQDSSIAVGSDGFGLISYYDRSSRDLKVAHCNNTVCSSATVSSLDTGGDVGQYTSLAIGSDGLGLIAYFDRSARDLKVAHCDNAACSSASVSLIDGSGDVGMHTSVAIGNDGLGLISYYDSSSSALKVAHCGNISCSSAVVSTIDSSGSVGEYSSITIGSDGLGLISYHDRGNRDLKVAHCDNASCSSVTVSTIVSSGDTGLYTSIEMGSDGLGSVSYYHRTSRDLQIAKCENTLCTSAAPVTVDASTDVGQFSSLVALPDGNGFVSYYDAANGDLLAAHCGAACGFAASASPPVIQYSTSPDRSNPLPLESGVVEGDIYVFVEGTDLDTVDVTFWVDDPGTTGSPYRIDDNPPWDLEGGDYTAALPFDTATLSDGSHEITAVVDSGIDQEVLTAPFTVANGQPPPQPEAELRFSSKADRSDPQFLDGAMVWGESAIFLFAEDSDIVQVTFYLDDPGMTGTPYSTDSDAPYDLNGSVSSHPASPAIVFDTSVLSEGTHEVTTLVNFVEPIEDMVLSASFEVDNERLASILAPEQGATLFATETLTTGISPGAPSVASVDFLLDGDVVASDGASPFEAQFDTSSVADGDFILVVRANLVGGGTEDSLPVTVSVDNRMSAAARVSEDYRRGLITADEHALWGLYSISNVDLLAPRYGTVVGEDGGTSTALEFLLEWDSLSQATRIEIEEYSTISEELIDPGQQFESLSVTNFPDCNRQSGQFVWISLFHGKVLRCQTTAGRYAFYYTLESLDPENGVAEVDSDSNGIPDFVDSVKASLDAAWEVYETTLHYDMPDTFPLRVVIHESRGAVLPPWTSLGSLTIQLDNTSGQFYLPRHELFHAVQYEYFDFLHVPNPQEIWWMEATAEWAAHQASGFSGDSEPERYAALLHRFMSTPEERVNSSAKGRQYGAFILAEFLEERVGVDGVRESWEAIDTGSAPLDAISDVIGGLDAELPGFARANYLLDSWDGSEPYLDSDVADWRDALGSAGGSVDGDSLGGPRPARATRDLVEGELYHSWVPLGYGGATYTDFVPPVGGDGFLVLQAGLLFGIDYQLLVFDDYPTLCRDPIEIGEATGGYVEVRLDADCSFATLVSTSIANAGPGAAAWEATFVPGDYPVLVGATNYFGGTSHEVDYLPNEQGSLLLAFTTYEATSGGLSVAWVPPGWTKLGQPPPAHTSSTVFYKVAEATTLETVDFATSTSTRMAAHIFEVSSWDGQTDPMISAANYASGIGTRFPDPGPVTTPWGRDSNLFLATVGVGSNFVWATQPVGYELLMFADANVGVSQGVAARHGFGPTEDPSPFEIGDWRSPWVSYTIAVRTGAP